MILLEFFKVFNFRVKRSARQRRYALKLNDQLLVNVKVIVDAQTSKTMQSLRTFAHPQYDCFYLLRNKKAYNTWLFKQNYDVIMCDRNFNVQTIVSSQQPNQIFPYQKDVHFIFFAPEQTLNFYQIKVGDELKITRFWALD